MNTNEPRNFVTAQDHALFASELLNGIAAMQHQIDNLTRDERLQMQVAGGVKSTNTNMEWTRNLALAHALTAIALAMPKGVEALDFDSA